MAKKLLNETVVRRFQKLANVKPLNEMYHMRDEDEMMEAEEEMEMDVEMGKEAEEAAPEADMGADAMGVGGDLELSDEEAQAIIDLGAKLQAAMGAGEEEMEAGEEEEKAEEEMGEEELMEALKGISYVPSKDEVVNEVAKRVARRLQEAKLHEAKLNKALGSRKK